MRIVHVTDCYLPRLGGIELQVHDLAQRQAAMGHDVTVLTTTAGDRGAGDGPVEVIRVTRRRADAESIGYRASFNAAAGLVGDLDCFDLVHAHASCFSPLSFLATIQASERGVPTATTLHSLWARSSVYFAAAHHLVRWGRHPVAWSAVSNVAAGPLREIVAGSASATSPPPVTVLPNGVDADRWKVVHERGPVSTLRIVAVARLARRKRIRQLLEIVKVVHDGLPAGLGLDVNILGDGPERGEIERYLRRHRMEPWVHLLGRRERDEIREVFARSDLFVAPATLESFGIAALEARCAGLPVLALAGTGVEDFVAHGREGWLVDSDAAMVQMISSLARSRDVLDHVARHNRSAPPSISWERVLDACEGLYQRASRLQGQHWRTPVPGPAAVDRTG